MLPKTVGPGLPADQTSGLKSGGSERGRPVGRLSEPNMEGLGRRFRGGVSGTQSVVTAGSASPLARGGVSGTRIGPKSSLRGDCEYSQTTSQTQSWPCCGGVRARGIGQRSRNLPDSQALARTRHICGARGSIWGLPGSTCGAWARAHTAVSAATHPYGQYWCSIQRC